MKKIFFMFLILILIFIYNFFFIVQEGTIFIQNKYNPLIISSKKNIFFRYSGIYIKIPYIFNFKVFIKKNRFNESGIYNIFEYNNSVHVVNTCLLWKINNNVIFFKKINNFNILKFEEYLQYVFFIKFHIAIENFFKKILNNNIQNLYFNKTIDINYLRLLDINDNNKKKNYILYFHNVIYSDNFTFINNFSSNFGIKIINFKINNFKLSKNYIYKILNIYRMKYEYLYKIHRLQFYK